jgi:glycosyltransferase involved in cell wall biosynthesis
LLPKVVKSANKIIAISETTKGDIIEWFKVDPDKISVIYNAAGDNFRPIDDEQVLCAAREKWTLPKNMILFVGTLEPRKNLINLMRAFKQMIERTDMPHTLVIAGGLGWGAKRVYEAHSAMGLGKRVRFLGYVPYDDLPLLYNLADAFAYVSHYEGFGLPILEALSCNIPALISTAPALTELAQDAALTVSADEVDDISERLEKILTDQDLRAGLIQKGQKRAKDFTQETFTRQTLDVLVEAGSRK